MGPEDEIWEYLIFGDNTLQRFEVGSQSWSAFNPDLAGVALFGGFAGEPAICSIEQLPSAGEGTGDGGPIDMAPPDLILWH